MRQLTKYTWATGKLSQPMKLLVVSDLHDAPYHDILPLLSNYDVLLLPGDMVDRYKQNFGNGLAFVDQASRILPTFVGVGNHEIRLQNFDAFREAVQQTKATWLMNQYVRFGDVVIGCWYQPEDFDQPDMLAQMEQERGCKVLMCHKPEEYIRHLQDADVDLVLSGHAHGGQIRIGQQGLYSPGQGIWPKYTRGVVNRMIISAGASNAVPFPRWGNPCELLHIDLT